MEQEGQMILNDKVVVETLERKNDLEAFIYHMRNELYGIYKEFVQ